MPIQSGIIGAARHAAARRARERRLNARDPVAGLFRTHTLPGVIQVADVTDDTVSPIVVTLASAHELAGGESITITGVRGNTAANISTTSWTASAVDEITLTATTGNGDYIDGGEFRGPIIDRAIDTATVFPVRTRPVTFAIDVKRTDTATTGVLFEFGGATRGVAAAFDVDDIVFCVGGDVGGADGIDLTIAAALIGEDVPYRLVFAVDTNGGYANVWLNGHIAGAGSSSGGALGTWTGTNDGSIGALGGASVSNRIPAPLRVSLADADVVSPLRVYHGQLPRQFRQFTLGSDGGFGSWSNTFSYGTGN